MTWASTGADSCTITPNIGSVDLNGSITVSPPETTTYFITATGAGGSAAAQVTVTIINPVPTVNITADPATIQIGESSARSWNSTNTDFAIIDQDIGDLLII